MLSIAHHKPELKMVYTFTPNDFARQMFQLQQPQYEGEGITGLLEQVLTKENAAKYLIAQDPLRGNKSSGKIVIILRGTGQQGEDQYPCIGTISCR